MARCKALAAWCATFLVALTAHAWAVVAFDAVASNSVAGSAGTTLTWTHTPVGTPTAVAVTLENYTTQTTVTGVTYGSATLTLATSVIDGNTNQAAVWCAPNPPSGAQTVTVTFAAAGAFTQAGSITVTGSSTSTCFDSSNNATGTSTAPSVAVTSATGELMVDVVASVTGGFPATPGGSQTSRWGPLTSSGNEAQSSTKPASAGSTTMSWTLGASEIWGIAAASFKAASGGGGAKPMNLPLLGVGQ